MDTTYLNAALVETINENERLKKLFKDKVQSHLQQLAEINELKEQLKEVRAVNEKLYDDLKFEGKDNYTITPPQMRSIIQALKRMGESLADEYADGGEGRFASNYAISLADDLERDLAR